MRRKMNGEGWVHWVGLCECSRWKSLRSTASLSIALYAFETARRRYIRNCTVETWENYNCVAREHETEKHWMGVTAVSGVMAVARMQMK